MTEQFEIQAVAPNGSERSKTVEGTRGDAESKVDELKSLGFDDVGIVSEETGASQNGTDGAVVQQESEAEVVDAAENAQDNSEADELPDDPSVADDPIDWVPGHFIDEIQGVPAINRKGYAVLAEQYGIQVTREFVTYPSETDFEFAEAEATAVTDDGREYCGFGSAHVGRDDDEHLLGELAETRAQKRALAMATGVGMVSVAEMKNTLEQPSDTGVDNR